MEIGIPAFHRSAKIGKSLTIKQGSQDSIWLHGYVTEELISVI